MMETMPKVNREGGHMAIAPRSRVASWVPPVKVPALSNAAVSLPERQAQPKPSPLRRWLPLALLALAALAVVATGAHRLLSIEAIVANKTWLENWTDSHRFAALATYMAVYVAIISLSIPGSLFMTLAGGMLFPLWICAPAVVVSATLGAVLVFLIARSSIGEALKATGGETLARVREGVRRDAASYMLFMRLAPVFPFALVNLVSAAAGVPLRTFVWTTFVGIMPASFAFSYAAVSLDGVLDERLAAFDACKAAGRADCAVSVDAAALVSPHVLLAFMALGLLALAPVAARRLGGSGRRG